jgi:hypothetical protein
MAARPALKKSEPAIVQLEYGETIAHLIGRTPMIFNRMGNKAKTALLLPSGRKTEADKAAQLKHDPIHEYRDSVSRHGGNTPVTRLYMPSGAFKQAMATAALDTAGVKKTEIERLVFMPEEKIDIFGVPKLLMSVVRNSDMNHTPDIRTRAILPEWACVVRLHYIMPKLTMKAIATLLANGGLVAGIGDWRQEKGSGSHGLYRLCDPDDADFKRIVATGMRKAQDAALERPECYDADSEDLLTWYQEEVMRRGRETPSRKRGVLVEDAPHGTA